MTTDHNQDDRPVFGYVRVSTDRQETERQERSIPERHRSLPDGLADRELELFYDQGISAWSGTRRPAFEEMFGRIERGEASALIIDTSSRLTRRGIREALSLFWTLEDVRCRLFTTEGREYAFNDLGGIISLIVDAEKDERFSSTLSHNIRTGKAAQVKSGRYHHGQLPPGYTRTEDGKLEATDDLPVIAELYRLFIAGNTFQQLGRYADAHLSAEYLAKLKNGADHHRVGAWLRHPLYVGLIRHKGQLHPSEHPAAVNEDVWDAAQAKFDRNRAANASRSPRAWPFAGIAKCGSCGHSLRLHNTGRSGRYVYLRCHDRACKQNGKSPISAIFEANVIVALVAIAYAVTTLLAEDPEFAVPIGPADETLAAARERVKTMNTELERVRNILITTGGAADDPRLLHLLDQRDAAREEAMILGRTMTDYRAELQALAESIFSLRYHVPPYDQAWLVKDWAMGPGFTPLFPDEMAEAVLLGWQHAPFDDRVTVVRNALSAVIYHGEEVELRFRSAVPERITTSAALIAERSPLVNALDEDGWGRSAYYDALAADESLAKPVWEGTGLDAPEPELGLTRPGSTPSAGPPLAAAVTSN